MSTFIIGTIVFGLLSLAIFKLVKDKKSDKGCCGCSGCSKKSQCGKSIKYKN